MRQGQAVSGKCGTVSLYLIFNAAIYVILMRRV